MTRVELDRWRRRFCPKPGKIWRCPYPEQAIRRKKRKRAAIAKAEGRNE